MNQPMIKTASTKHSPHTVVVSTWAIPMGQGTTVLSDLEQWLDFSSNQISPEWFTPLMQNAHKDAQLIAVVADHTAGRARISISTGSGSQVEAVHVYIATGDSVPGLMDKLETLAKDISQKLELRSDCRMPAVNLHGGRTWASLWAAIDRIKGGEKEVPSVANTIEAFDEAFGRFTVDVRKWWHEVFDTGAPKLEDFNAQFGKYV